MARKPRKTKNKLMARKPHKTEEESMTRKPHKTEEELYIETAAFSIWTDRLCWFQSLLCHGLSWKQSGLMIVLALFPARSFPCRSFPRQVFSSPVSHPRFFLYFSLPRFCFVIFFFQQRNQSNQITPSQTNLNYAKSN